MEESHTINHKILFSKLKVIIFLSLYHFFGDHSQRETTFFCTFVSSVVESKETAIASQSHSILKIILDLTEFGVLKLLASHNQLIKCNNITHIDTLTTLILVNNSKSVIFPIPSDITNFFFDLNTDYLKLFLATDVTDLDCSCKMVLFNEFFHDYSYPISSFRHEYLSLFGMVTPSPPFSLSPGLNII